MPTTCRQHADNRIDKKVIIVLGPTCVGKTSVSLLLAERLATEIVSADSMQVYRGMDVGTAKPTAVERARVPHHMIDLVAPHESYSSGRYVTDVAPVLESLFWRGMTPIVVGGSGLYIRAMTAGLFSAPDADWPLRRRLMAMEGLRPGALHEYLGELDPEASEKLRPSDARRIVRALEVCIRSGAPVSRLRRELTARVAARADTTILSAQGELLGYPFTPPRPQSREGDLVGDRNCSMFS